MIKFILKRRKSSKTIRKLKREAELRPTKVITLVSGVEQVQRVYTKHDNQGLYDRNNLRKDHRRKIPTIYQLEDQHNNNCKRHKVNYSEWFAFRILSTARNETQKQRIYKLYPRHNPKILRELEHQKKVRAWQSKLKKNEHLQNQT